MGKQNDFTKQTTISTSHLKSLNTKTPHLLMEIQVLDCDRQYNSVVGLNVLIESQPFPLDN
jgi:hypothetical protein